MVQRGLIDKARFRVSRPGVDVNSAEFHEFMFHEQFLFTQPYFFKYVPCPFAGYVGTGVQESLVEVPIPDVTPDPIVIIRVVDRTDKIVFPLPRSYGTGSDTSGYAMDGWSARFKVESSTLLTIRFNKPDTRRYSPNGAYVVLMRRPDA